MSVIDLDSESWMQMEILLPCGSATLSGNLHLPKNTHSMVIMLHCGEVPKLKSRNVHIAERLNERGIGTFQVDLLTAEERKFDRAEHALRYDVEFLSTRAIYATKELLKLNEIARFKIGYFGTGTGAAAALNASVALSDVISAVVTRAGRTELAMELLCEVKAPTLLIVGDADPDGMECNKEALAELRCQKRLAVVAGATRFFEEPDSIEKIIDLAAQWFSEHLS